jgi:3-hydroxybutyryl-CoA dehydrogenase
MNRPASTAEGVGVVGAGLMGTGIAAVFAAAGIGVLLHDTAPERLAAATAEIRRIASELEGAALLSPAAAAALPSGVCGSPQLGDLAGRTFVLEAVPERVAIKRAVYADLERTLAPDAIIASNTSGLMPSLLAEEMQRPERFLVAHFWNPPYAIPLVEVVPGPATVPTVLDRTVRLLQAIGQEPVVLHREIPGFVGNRLQYALLREALAIVRSGAASAAEVDAVMRASLGRRLAITGPIETADLGGLDTFLSVAEQLMPHLAKDEAVLDLIRARVAAGDVGLRSGEGFYPWPPERVAAVRGRRDRDLLRRRREDHMSEG